MGHIIDCRDAGIPEELLIPIEPMGKKPAVPNAIGEWVGLDGWEKLDISWQVKAEADERGASCGLVMGSGAQGLQFAAVDIDLFEGNERHRDSLVNYIASIWPDFSLLIRETVPYRAMLLVKISDVFSAGRKSVYF